MSNFIQFKVSRQIKGIGEYLSSPAAPLKHAQMLYLSFAVAIKVSRLTPELSVAL